MSSTDTAEDGLEHAILPKLSFLLAGIASAPVVLMVYHCVAVYCRSRQRRRRDPEQLQQLMNRGGDRMLPIRVNLVMIPAHKYRKGMELKRDDDGVCAVCLSEFEEGEELRTLPGCTHSFHVDCIDMWLYSHKNCPLCRSDLLRQASPESSASDQVTDVVVQNSRP